MSWWYPRFNKTGSLASGNGEIWFNGVNPGHQLVPGHSPQWFGDPEDKLALIGDALRLVDMVTGEIVQALPWVFNPRVGNTSGIAAGAGHWCGWNVSQGLIYDGVSVDPAAAPGAVDQRTGALYYLTPYQANQKRVVLDGTVVREGVVATEIMAGEACATWGEYEPNRTLYGWAPETGIARLSPLPSTELTFTGVPVRTPTGLWLVTLTHKGLIVYPWGGADGYILEGVYYYHHAIFLNGVIEIAATNDQGGIVRTSVSLNAPRVDLRTYRPTTGSAVPVGPITPINRKMFLMFYAGAPGASGGWDTNDDPPGTSPTPGNGRLDVPSATLIDETGKAVAVMVTGGSVEEIEQKAATSPLTPFCYWDARRWPRLPNVPPGAWLAVQGYRGATESLEAFEADMRAILAQHIAERPQLKHAPVPQCYTSNVGNTTDLGNIVSVFSRIAADTPEVYALVPFSGSGRKTGLQDHPDVRPYWQQLADSITGRPDSEVPVAEFPREAWTVVEAMHTKYAQKCIDEHPSDMDAAARDWTEMVVQQLVFSYPQGGWIWKSGDSTRPPSKDVSARQLAGRFDGWDMLKAASINGPRDLADYPPGWHDLAGQHPIPVTGVNWLKTAPEPGTIEVRFQDYQTTVRRSDPKGLTLYWDIDSTHPVEGFEVQLVGAPEVFRMTVQPPFPPDGRYFRGLAWKPTMNGTFTPRLLVRDTKGNEATVEGVPVTVIP